MIQKIKMIIFKLNKSMILKCSKYNCNNQHIMMKMIILKTIMIFVDIIDFKKYTKNKLDKDINIF